MADFKDRFRKLRNERDMNQESLSKDFNSKFHYNFGKSSISMYENGKRMPEISALEDFATYFGVSVDYLLGRVDVREPYNDRTRDECMDQLSNGDELSPESKKELEKYKELLRAKEHLDKTREETLSTLEREA